MLRKRLLFAGTMALVLGIGLYWKRDRPSESAQPPRAVQPSELPGDTPSGAAPAAQPGFDPGASGVRSVGSPAGSPAEFSLTVAVLAFDESSHSPLPGVRVSARFAWKSSEELTTTEVVRTTDSTGAADLRIVLPLEAAPGSFGCTLSATHDGFGAAVHHVSREAFRAAAPSTLRAVAELGLGRVHRICGTILDRTGAGIADARVVLAEDLRPRMAPRALAFSRANEVGTYSIETGSTSDHELILMVRAPGFLPRGVRTRLDMEGTVRQDPIVLDTGVGIAGWVHGLREFEECGFEVHLRPTEQAGFAFQDSRFGDVELLGSEMVPLSSSSVIRGDGRFEVSGLLPREYILSVEGTCCGFARDSIPTAWVQAPGQDVVIDVSAALHRIEVLDAGTGAALELAQFGSLNPAGGRCALGHRGSPGVLVAPHEVMAGVISAEGFLPVPVELPALEAGAIGVSRVPLQRLEPQGTWSLRVLDPSGRPVPHLEVSVRPSTASDLDLPTRWYSDSPDGLHRLPLRPPGDYTVWVDAATQANGWESHLLATRRTLRLGELERTVDIRLEEGGFLAVDVLDSEGRPLEGAIAVCHPPDTAPLETAWILRGPPTTIWMGKVPRGAGARSLRAFAEGLYRVSVRAEGFQQAERDVEIQAGRTEKAEFRLERAKGG